MNSSLIRQYLHEQTDPFAFRLSDGSRVKVLHPDFVAVSPGLVLVISGDESVTRIDPLHIVAIEESPSRRKGKARP